MREDWILCMSVSNALKLDSIHSGPRHRLYRGRRNAAEVVVKMTAGEHPAAHAVASLRHEYELLRELDVPGVVTVLGLTHLDDGLALLRWMREKPASPSAFRQDRFRCLIFWM
jgi:hypothetical protein